ncbi:hypothetical protein LOAG_12533 [Loa loa]|uniref:Uncharacterized protein n=1 Tax=Loa loa TaxID=7209 RepID=A0A1S0TLI5_LOALO|nr:hypothetical protein LOAG_12533 [Loa loa]EFO15973.1 hypothetical protein LOAG_12533 [Loa loa]
MVDKHPKNNLNDFIFDDNYFEDSWGLHSNLLFTSYMHQVNTFMPAPLRVAAAISISAEMSRHYSMHRLKAVHLRGTESKTEEYRCSSEECSTLDQTDHNMNGTFIVSIGLLLISS